jgi:nitrogen fixation NifU-like protein
MPDLGELRPPCGIPIAKESTIQGAEELLGKGVYHAVKDPSVFVDKRVLIVDRGTASVDIALELAKHTGRVIFISPAKAPTSKDDPRTPLIRTDVKVVYEAEPIAVLGDDEVEKVRVHDLNEDEEYELFVDALVILE